MSAVDAQAEIARIETLFRVLPDTADIYDEWKRLVTAYGVIGVGVYDTRLVAAMVAHGVPRLVTFNVGDFRRYTQVAVTHPQDVR